MINQGASFKKNSIVGLAFLFGWPFRCISNSSSPLRIVMSSTPLTVKLVLLGDSRVGKSSVVIRFVKNEFDQYKFPTIGATFLTQSMSVADFLVKFEIMVCLLLQDHAEG